jgi:DNA-binding PadR family transcriptional regulator
MPKPQGSIGETKFKILAIIYKNDFEMKASYGYNIWTILKNQFYCYLDNANLRNVYRHLKDLDEAGLVKKRTKQTGENAPERQLYTLTEMGRQLKDRYNRYLHVLRSTT